MQHNTASAEDDQFPNQCNINRAHDPIFALRSSICGALRGNLSEKTVSFRVGISGRPRVLINQATPKQCHPTSSQVSCALRSEIRNHFWSLTSFLYPCMPRLSMRHARMCWLFCLSSPLSTTAFESNPSCTEGGRRRTDYEG